MADPLDSVKRYDLITNYRCGSSIEEMEPSDDGEWVRFDDVLALAREREQQVESLTRIQRENAEAMAMWSGRALKAEQQLSDLRQALKDYGQHKPSCAMMQDIKASQQDYLGSPIRACDCGFSAVLAVGQESPR